MKLTIGGTLMNGHKSFYLNYKEMKLEGNTDDVAEATFLS